MNSKNQELSDYLFEILKTISFESEEDKKEITEYINTITIKTKSLYTFLEKDENITKVVRFLEKLQEDANV